MSLFQPRVFPEIMGDMVSRLLSATPLTDVNFGSVFTMMLEAAATEDDEQYFQMLEIIRGYSIDTTTGDDLDLRAEESVGLRLTAQSATSIVTISDTAITKVETPTFSGLAGAIKDQEFIFGDSATGFSATGSIIVGRDTSFSETIPYLSITQFTNYVQFNLDGGLAFDHGTDETIILAQGGDRTIGAGTLVYVPESDISARVEYTTDVAATILNGESEVLEVSISASAAGSEANVPIGSIQQFDSKPFPTASVRNPNKITNGRAIETDQELRDRIKDHIQSLSRGTKKSITTGINGLVSSVDNKRVVSSSLVEPTVPADVVKLYIDDGGGTIFPFSHVGQETIVSSATGGEKFLKVINTPLVKATVETNNEGPYNISGGETLFVDVGGVVETIIFESTDFAIPGEATAQECLVKINSVASSFESRISAEGSSKFKIFSRFNQNEEIRVTGGTANAAFAFQTDLKVTSKLYLKRDNQVQVLSKDGRTASIEAGSSQTYNMGSYNSHLSVIIDNKTIQNIYFLQSDFVNPVAALAEEIIALINKQLAGALAQESFNGNKFRINSLTTRSLSSSVRIVANFTKIFSEEVGALVDRTSDMQDDGIDTVAFADDLDYLYVIHNDVKFNSIFFAMNTVASANLDLALEYWDGAAWSEVGYYDNVLGLTQDGTIFFPIPFDWAITTVSGNAGYAVRLQRNQAVLTTPPQINRVRACQSNEAFGFSEAAVVGSNKDYSINRFIGQIELESPLNFGDKLEMGSFETYPQVRTGIPGNYTGLVGTTLEILIDGVSSSYTFVTGDFFDDLSILASEVVTAINSNFIGLVSSSSDGINVDVYGNRLDGGSLQVVNSGANTAFQFPSDLKEGLTPHVSSSVSVPGPFVFPPDDKLVVVVDGNLSNVFDLPLFYTNTLTNFVDTSNIQDSTANDIFLLDDDVKGFDMYIGTGALLGERVEIAAYTAATGNFQLATPLSGDPGNETYYLIPKTGLHLQNLLNRSKITSLSNRASILALADGSLQISTKVAGEDGSIQVAGGTGNDLLLFSTEKFLGVDGYRYYTGLPQLVQWTVDGRDDNEDEFDGIRAAGVQVEVAEPVTRPITIRLDVTTQEGTTLSSITSSIKSEITGYVNQLGVGDDVILSDVICAVKAVIGVFDVAVTAPLENISIADNEQAKVAEKDISVG